jgi:hypothetical protein
MGKEWENEDLDGSEKTEGKWGGYSRPGLQVRKINARFHRLIESWKALHFYLEIILPHHLLPKYLHVTVDSCSHESNAWCVM